MSSLLESVGTQAAPDTLPAFGAFPTAELVDAAAGLFHGHRLEHRELGVTLGGVLPSTVTLDGSRVTAPSWAKAVELYGGRVCGVRLPENRRPELELVEGPRWRVMVSPGSVSVRYSDPARAERAAERALEAWWKASDLARALGVQVDDSAQGGRAAITAWSRKSRSRMREVIQQLDWSTVLDAGRAPSMVTVTYPGDWESVAPNSRAVARHVEALKTRFARDWGSPIRAVWKREFQRRGAPHYHFLMVVPAGLCTRTAERFPAWLSRSWAEIVGSESCGYPQAADDGLGCCERHRHLAAGTGIDTVAGVKMTDPRLIAAYFSKHGSFAEKEYQNEAPELWAEQGSVGRFWGVWGIRKALAGTYVAPAEGLAAARTMRRYSRANSRLVDVPLWRYRSYVDEDGQDRARWRLSRKRVRMFAVKDGRSGFLAVPDGPSFASQLARHLDQLYRPGNVESPLAGPVGFLP